MGRYVQGPLPLDGREFDEDEFAGFGVDLGDAFGAGVGDLSAAVSVGQGALAMAVGRARAASGLPLTFEEAARSVMDAVDGPGSAAAAGLVGAVNRAGEIFAANIRQAAADIGSNLTEVSRGFDVLRAAYTSEGNAMAARAATLLGGGTAANAAAYSIVYVGTLLYQQGVFDSVISTIKTAVMNDETLSKIGSALGLTGTASPAAGAFIGAAVSTLFAMWDAWKKGTSIDIGSEPPSLYWGQLTTAIYAWDGKLCGPSWGKVKDTNSPTFDPILREWQVVTDYSMKPKRLVDVYGRAKLRGEQYKKWISRSGGAGCSSVGGSITDGKSRYNPLGEGGMYNPSAWISNDATRMRGVKAPWYCAHAAKVQIWCDGSNRNNNICRMAFQYGPGSGSDDLSFTLRGALVAAAYLGSNVAGIQNLGRWDSPNCGIGDGTWIPGRFWDLGIGGSDAVGAKRSNWLACVLTTGQVLLRPPVAVTSLLNTDASGTARVAFLNKGIWYPMYKMEKADADEFAAEIRSWNPLYADMRETSGEIPLTVENGIAQQSPKPTLKLATRGMKPMTVAVDYKSGDKTGLSRNWKIGLTVVGGTVAVATGGYLWHRHARRSRRAAGR